MRQLVYRVQPMPASLLPLIFDFGQLDSQTETVFVKQMLKKAIRGRTLPPIEVSIIFNTYYFLIPFYLFL